MNCHNSGGNANYHSIKLKATFRNTPMTGYLKRLNGVWAGGIKVLVGLGADDRVDGGGVCGCAGSLCACHVKIELMFSDVH